MIKRCIEVKFFDINAEKFAPGVEIVDSKSNLAIVKLAVGIATSHG